MYNEISRTEQELLEQLRNLERKEDKDDFYNERYIDQQLADDCLDEEEGAFMIGYLNA